MNLILKSLMKLPQFLSNSKKTHKIGKKKREITLIFCNIIVFSKLRINF